MTVIKFHELFDYDKSPQRGKHNYYDSKVVELEFDVEGIKHYVKCIIDMHYSRWVHPETAWCPKEDESNIISFKVETIKGTKIVKGDEVILTEKELRKLQTRIEEEIIFE